MFDIGWTEMVVVVVLAIIVIGPKDLPKLIRTIGQWTGRARALAREFQSSIDDIAREAELDEIKKSVETATKFDIKKEIENSIDPTGRGLDGALLILNCRNIVTIRSIPCVLESSYGILKFTSLSFL